MSETANKAETAVTALAFEARRLQLYASQLEEQLRYIRQQASRAASAKCTDAQREKETHTLIDYALNQIRV